MVSLYSGRLIYNEINGINFLYLIGQLSQLDIFIMKRGWVVYKKILVPLDGSRLAERALIYAIWLAQRSNAEVIITHVYQNKIAYPGRYLKRIIAEISDRTHKPGDNQTELRVGIEILAGDPATEILKYADENRIDIITMSTHGHSGIRHWLLGSVADRVVRRSRRPVWLINPFNKKTDELIEKDKTVLVLLDGSELAEKIIPYAAYHAGLSEGELVLLSVCEPPEIIPAVTYHLIPDQYPPRRPVQWEKYVREEEERREAACRLYLEQNLETHKNKIKLRYEYRLGDAAGEITKYLQTNPVSLVAMTTRGRSGLSRWVYGSVAEKVLAASRSPLLIMRPG
jgi:nucleotide-binding universal stress UspA family protein